MVRTSESLNEDRFMDLVSYVVRYSHHQLKSPLNRTKLNKLLWMIDIAFYCRTGESLSGESHYVKRQYGPVPPRILSALEELQEKKAIRETEIERGGGLVEYLYEAYPGDFVIGKSEAFSAGELSEINRYCKLSSEKSAIELSRFSHDQVFDSHQEGDLIPLEAYLSGEFRKPSSNPARSEGCKAVSLEDELGPMADAQGAITGG